MCHGSGAISSLFLLVILRAATVKIHGCRKSIASAPTIAFLGTGSDGTGGCAFRHGACVGRSSQTRITQLDQALQQGGRSFVMKAYAGAIDQDLSTDMTTAEYSTDAMRNDGRERKVRSVQLCFVLIMLCTGGALDRIANAPHGWGMEAWRMLFQAKNTARLFVMMLEVLAVLKRCGEQSGDDGTEDQRVREIREHRNSGISGDWHRDSSSRIRTDENASHHELAQVGNIPGHQNGSDKRQTSPECSEGEIGRRNGRGCFHERIQRSFQRFSQETGLRSGVLVLREERSSSFRLSQEAKGQRQ